MDAGSSRYPHLFSELEVGARTLRNRIALPATLTNYGSGNRITDRWVNFLAERARGGCGLVVSEIIAVDPEALAHGAIVTGYEEANDPGFKQVADEVRAAGGCILGQLWHPGRQQLWHPTRSPAGVSDQPDALSWTVPRVMSTQECARLVDAYVAVARRLARCGFDGVELHGAHGYLITQFLSPWSNTREDGYGGDLEGRTRFVREAAERVRDACGEAFIVGLKMPADEGVEGGIDVEEAARITERLASTGAFDLFAYGQGNFSLSLENHVPDMHFRPGHFIDLHRRMREVSGGIPVMAIGRVGTPDLAERIVAEGYGDLVGMTRAQVSDAAFSNKSREGREDEIRPCIFDNFCWGEVHAGKPIAEFHNPRLGERGEADWTPSAASRPCKVVVVGAGPAGLEAAWVAAARGHEVHLLGAGPSAGGKLRVEARLPGHGDVAKVTEHQLRMAERHGVRLTLGHRSDEAAVRALAPDALVVASGAKMRRPRWAWSNSMLVVSTAEFAERLGTPATPSGRHRGAVRPRPHGADLCRRRSARRESRACGAAHASHPDRPGRELLQRARGAPPVAWPRRRDGDRDRAGGDSRRRHGALPERLLRSRGGHRGGRYRRLRHPQKGRGHPRTRSRGPLSYPDWRLSGAPQPVDCDSRGARGRKCVVSEGFVCGEDHTVS